MPKHIRGPFWWASFISTRRPRTIRIFLTLLAVAALTSVASAHYTPGCKHQTCKIHVIRPYMRSFLGPVGACESGTTYHLKHGLRVIDPGGIYRGRYQFGWSDWLRAGGKGDPSRASWYEQGYRAVVWLHRNGRSSWPNC